MKKEKKQQMKEFFGAAGILTFFLLWCAFLLVCLVKLIIYIVNLIW